MSFRSNGERKEEFSEAPAGADQKVESFRDVRGAKHCGAVDVLSIERLAAEAEAGGKRASTSERARGGGRRVHPRLLPERDGLHVQGAHDVS